MPDEHRSHTVSLGDLAMGKEDEVLGLLNRGTIHEGMSVFTASLGHPRLESGRMENKRAMGEEVVVIVGAGQSGLAAAACLTALSVPCVILERDDCIASLWRNRCYDRVSLHLQKQLCQLPQAPHPPETPMYMPKQDFIRYLEDYAARFRLRINLHRKVESTEYDAEAGKWRLVAMNGEDGSMEEYVARYVVVATGENDEIVVPEIPGLEGFSGPVVHSSLYRSGSEYEGKSVLVVGCGNSGMEVALDLAEHGATTHIVVRSKVRIHQPIHVLLTASLCESAAAEAETPLPTYAMILSRFLPCKVVDTIILLLCHLEFGSLAEYGIRRPAKGPMYLKEHSPVYPVMDCGTVKKIKSGHIKVCGCVFYLIHLTTGIEQTLIPRLDASQVLPAIKHIEGDDVTFSDGRTQHFDAIVLATGYRSTVKRWLKGDDCLIDEAGMAKETYPNNWKGRNGLYCAGLARRGIYGSAEDALKIADDIADDHHKHTTQ
ncbi:hypothetical protein GW17_00044250 [Ensete ventricosum]|nr:hypothetical protein GW17_00044250 [Ensete ventricosum]